MKPHTYSFVLALPLLLTSHALAQQQSFKIDPQSSEVAFNLGDVLHSDFVLYRGTGLAPQLGHRISEDFDFFSSSSFDAERLRSRLPFFRDLNPSDPDVWVHRKRDNLEAFVNRGGVVKVAFFGGLDTLRRVEDPRQAAGSRVQVASLVDLAGMKMRVIQVRATGRTM